MTETERSSQFRCIRGLAGPVRSAEGHNQSREPEARATRLISDARQLPHSTPANGREGTPQLFATPTGLPVTTPCNSAAHREHWAALFALGAKWMVRMPDGKVSTFFRRPLVLCDGRVN